MEAAQLTLAPHAAPGYERHPACAPVCIYTSLAFYSA